MKNKILCFTFILTILLIGVTAISASDVNNTNTQVQVTDNVIDDVASNDVQTDNILEKNTKNIKNDDEYDGITVTQENFTNYFNTNGNTKDTVTSNSKLRFSGEIDVNQNIIIDKALNITSDNAIIKLNTNTFTINNGGSNTNITGLNFSNTKVFVDGASNVVLNKINVTAKDQTIGWNTGVTSIREGSFNITVANSTFYTKDNGGSSTLVLANAKNCTIENNVITAEGGVGNLLYLTTYNINSQLTEDSNSYNVIRNNTLTGPETPSIICWALVLSGHNNTIDNNTIDYTGVGITSQVIIIDDEFNYEHQITENNTVTYNNINNGASVVLFNNSKVIGNNFTGNVVIGQDSTIEYNQIPNNFNVAYNCEVHNNQFGADIVIADGSELIFNDVTCNAMINGDGNSILDNQIDGDLTISSDYNHIQNNDVNNIFLINGASSNQITDNNFVNMDLEIGTEYNTVAYNNVLGDIRDRNEDDSTNVIEDNNFITENNLNVDDNYLVENNLNVDNSKKNLKMDDDEYTTIVITNENYQNYFITRNQNNILEISGIRFTGQNAVPNNRNVIFYFNETINDLRHVTFSPNRQYSYIMTANPNLTFRNIKWDFSCVRDHTLIVTNMTFDYGAGYDAQNISNRQPIMTYGSSKVIFDNITFNSHITRNDLKVVDEETQEITEYNLPYLIYVNANTEFRNCNINMSCFATTVDWMPGSSTYGKNSLIPIYQKNGTAKVPHFLEMYNNTIFINTTETYGSYATIYGLDLHDAAILKSNNITLVAGEGWMYAIHPRSCPVNITEHIIRVSGINYTSAIGLESPYDCIIDNNTIYVNSSMDEQPNDGKSNEYCTYAIFINDYGYMGGYLDTSKSKVFNNTISNNHIIGNAFNTYAIEEFGGKENKFINNTIEVNAATAMGIGVIGTDLTIANNTLLINGTRTTGLTIDYLGAMTTGIYVARGSNNTVTGNNITSTKLGMYVMFERDDLIENNTILTDYENAIYLQKVNNSIIDYNYLESEELNGNHAVIDNEGVGNTIKYNLPEDPKYFSLKIDTTEFTLGTNATIKASIYYGNEDGQEVAENITKGKVAFKVNGKTLKSTDGKVIYAKVVNGIATIENYEIPESWDKEGMTIEAVYSGSLQCDSLRSDKQELTINKEVTPLITTEDVLTTIGSTVTLKATVTGPEEMLNNAKVVFKINGKSVKDENGKVIYAKIVNGEVSVEYKIPDTYNARNYTLTAVYIASNYNRLEDSKTLTITKE